MNETQNKTLTVGNWTLAIASTDPNNIRFTNAEFDLFTLVATHSSNTPVVDTEQETGGDDELGYRLTALAIERQYDDEGEARLDPEYGTLISFGVKVDIIVDSDEHLNLYIKPAKEGDDVEQHALTNGTEHSPSCDLELELTTSN